MEQMDVRYCWNATGVGRVPLPSKFYLVWFHSSSHPKLMPAAAAALPTNFMTCGPPVS
jgi:hypothetical protein